VNKLEAFALVVLVILAGLFTADHDAWTPDEPRVVALGQSVAQGSWVVPRLGGEPFLEQPPLHGWSVALAYRALGESVTVARAVSVLFSLLTLGVTFLLGERLASRRVGALAALLLGTSFLFFYCEHRVTTDPPLALFVAGSTLASLVGLTSNNPRERLLGLFLAYALASLAYLAKGVVGVGLAGFGFLAVVIAERDLRLLLRAKLWLAPLVFALVTGSYHLRLHEELGTAGLRTVVLTNTVERAGTDSQHGQRFYYYLWSFPLNFLPTTVFFLGGVLWYWKNRPKAFVMPLAWFLLGLVGLSIAHSKREVYLLSILPAAALVSALWLEEVLEGRDRGVIARFLPEVLAGLVLLLGLALPVGAVYLGRPRLLPVLAGSFGITAALFAFVQLSRGKTGPGLAVVLVGALPVLAAADLTVVPYVDEKKALGDVIRAAALVAPRDRALYVICPDETALGVIPFYGGRDVAMIPTALGMKDPFREAASLLAAHLHGEREVWALAIEKNNDEPCFRCVQRFGPEIAFSWSGTRPGRLLRFRAGR
jgi:4-amino-4-deoxy-L-arabinose transferase-like glycosyltransferase